MDVFRIFLEIKMNLNMIIQIISAQNQEENKNKLKNIHLIFFTYIQQSKNRVKNI